MKRNKFPVTGTKFPVTGNTFPLTRNKFPVTRSTKNTSCHRKNILLRKKYTSCDRLNSLYSCQRNSDILNISCDKKISPSQKNNFSINCQNNWLNDRNPSKIYKWVQTDYVWGSDTFIMAKELFKKIFCRYFKDFSIENWEIY